MKGPRIASIILAAGQSRRMGKENKLLLPYNGQPLIRHVVDQTIAAEIRDIIVVTGHQESQIHHALVGQPVFFTHNTNYPEGMSGSLKAGLTAVPESCDGILVQLADMPHISPEILRALIRAYAPLQKQSIIIPSHKGRRGNPLLWGRGHFPAFASLKGDQGAKGLLKLYQDNICEVEVGSDAIFRDVDNPMSYETLTSPRP